VFRRSEIRRCLFGVVALLVLTPVPAALAGGFYIVVERPAAGSNPKLKDAVMVARPHGCIDPAMATLSATAEGLVGGQRRSVPVRLTTVSPGVYAVKRQWPKEGVWLLAFTSTLDRLTCSRLVPLGPKGDALVAQRPGNDPAREAVTRTVHRRAAPGEIDAALRILARKGGGDTQISRSAR
jgi:hypothetical protein